ncbi:hypothetical protein PF005_g9212 [Phytophthora fragariae]|uniref:FAD-binding FR-type domain-containing protein n=1 Tax=Phytophthora fragariae TaxID=53985 RepID=A0A6A3FK92_9STRA|nr:hypothetical protein PF009_g4704 [Phytophthora fragariae]KAE9013477.1 hypothetical protein PF011_g8470 [Phytophthora fragariae]KAE9216006.1 hypothetical protein PF005_g9212 [Phytophthora fragariae]
MAPTNTMTPHPDVEFADLKTPADDLQDKRGGLSVNRAFGPSPWPEQFSLLGNLAQVVILASIFVYAYGQLFYFSDAFTNTGAGGHSEMVRPMFFSLFCFLPMAVSIVLLEFLRHFNVRRISSRYVLNLARFLRLKPRVMGRVVSKSLGELLFLVFLVGGNIYVFQYFYRARVERMKTRTPDLDFSMYLQMIALTFGIVCVYNMAFLFLPATRNCVWMEFLNISYANGIKYHRWVEVITVVTAFLHCLGYYWAWIKAGTWVKEALPCFNCAVGKEGKDPWMNFFGLIALLSFLAIGFTSMPWVRRKMYNTFYSVHHLFILGTVFAVLHWNPILAWIFPSVMLYVICRALSSSNGFTPVAVREFTTISHDVVKVVLARSTSRAGDFKVGQFVYLNVPAISKLQWHAFTISSSPRASPDTLTILLKSLGDWTEELVQYSEDCNNNNVLPSIYMDGYYGGSLEMYDEYSTVCLVGGGIGVTPLLSILEDVVAKLQQGASIRQKVFFIFTFRELSLLEEIHPLLMQIKELDPQELYFSLHFSLTRAPTNDQLDQAIDHGRLTGKSHASATRYDTSVSSKFLYGNKVQTNDSNLWPLQNFVEITLVIVVAMTGVYAFTFAESKRGKESAAAFGHLMTPGGIQPYASDAHTFRDLVTDYRVAVGQRPNMPELMCKVYSGHKQFAATHPSVGVPGNSTVGVFFSGPRALKHAMENAISDIGINNFDVHEEEFEL